MSFALVRCWLMGRCFVAAAARCCIGSLLLNWLPALLSVLVREADMGLPAPPVIGACVRASLCALRSLGRLSLKWVGTG